MQLLIGSLLRRQNAVECPSKLFCSDHVPMTFFHDRNVKCVYGNYCLCSCQGISIFRTLNRAYIAHALSPNIFYGIIIIPLCIRTLVLLI